jgi:hypothetical protein
MPDIVLNYPLSLDNTLVDSKTLKQILVLYVLLMT